MQGEIKTMGGVGVDHENGGTKEKEWLFGKTLSELSQIVSQVGMPGFSAGQIASWLYQKEATNIDQMTNLSLKHRELLKERYQVGVIAARSVVSSKDGTKKYLFPTLTGHNIESAYIPDRERATLCVSSQVGCKMGCEFCATGRQGFQANLSAGEIINQVRSIEESSKLTNIVYMGMGEPLDNIDQVMKSLEIMTSDWGYGWSPTRITLSTIGVIPALRRFLEESKVHLAVSLHNPFGAERVEIIPSEKVYPISEVVDLIRKYDFSQQRRVSFEYILLNGLNDTPRYARGLVRLLSGLRCRVNLIRFHKIPDSPFFSPDDEKMTAFRDSLTDNGLFTTIRTSRGEDIQAACGLLSTAEPKESR